MLPPDLYIQMKAAFKKYDTNSSGKIDHMELQNAFERIGQKMSIDEVARILEAMDIDNDGEISFTEFTVMVASQVSERPPEEKLSEFAESFCILGGNHDLSGVISRENVSELVERFGLTIDVSQFGDELTYGDFEKLMSEY